MATTAIVLAAVLYFNPLADADLHLQDRLLNSLRRTASNTELVLLAVDDQSTHLGSAVDSEEIAGSKGLQLMEKGFPWSREVYALAAKRLLDAGAKLVVFDLLFPLPRQGDDALAEVLREYPGKIVLASNFEKTEETGNTSLKQQYAQPTSALLEAAGPIGFVTLPTGHGSKTRSTSAIIRSFWPWGTESTIFGDKNRPEEEPIPSLATAAALSIGQKVPVSFKPLRFAYQQNAFRIVSLYEIFVPALWKVNHGDGSKFKDRVVLVGPTAQHMQDFHMTPIGRKPGPAIHLYALSALMNNGLFKETGLITKVVSVLVAGLAAFVLIMVRRSPRMLIAGLIGGTGLWVVICMCSLTFASLFLPIVPPLATWLLCGFAGLAVDVSMERADRARMRAKFERYVSKDVVKMMVEDEASFQKMLGRKEIVALFSDLQGFTTDSEKIDPAELLRQLNAYFTEMVQAVFAHNGTLDKFMGDAIMATWGGIRPKSPEDDARRAVEASLEMKERLAVMNADRDAAGLAPWNSGIGISQGMAVFGEVGSEDRKEATAIGDSINLASRIEGLTRVYSCGILVDERIAARARGVCDFLPVDTVRVKGRRKPEQLFMPYRRPDPDWVAEYLVAQEKYRAGDFAAAREIFARLAEGGLVPPLAKRFLIRCEAFLEKPPGPEWAGVWDFFEK